jgi:hypothetical protein
VAGQRAAEQRPGGPHPAVRGTGAQPQPVAQPRHRGDRRRCSVGPGSPCGHRRWPVLAATGLPSRPAAAAWRPAARPRRHRGAGPGPGRRAPWRPRSATPARLAAREVVGPDPGSKVCSSPWGQPINPTPEHMHPPEYGQPCLDRSGRRQPAGPAARVAGPNGPAPTIGATPLQEAWGATTVSANSWSPTPERPCQASTWGPNKPEPPRPATLGPSDQAPAPAWYHRRPAATRSPARPHHEPLRTPLPCRVRWTGRTPGGRRPTRR